MKNKALNITLTVLFTVLLVLFMLTVSIGLPIYCRFFYYIQIKTLNMEQETGFSYEVIKRAYDDVLNYLTLPGFEFATGELKYTADEAAHFADCKVLFNLNLGVMLVSGAGLLTLILLQRFKKICLVSLKGHRPYFYSAIFSVVLPVVLALLISIDFDRAFEIFHAIFFPGKTNWTFDPDTEQIIQVMPEEFFMNCAILIGVGLVVFAAALITVDLVKKRRQK